MQIGILSTIYSTKIETKPMKTYHVLIFLSVLHSLPILVHSLYQSNLQYHPYLGEKIEKKVD
jgi:hypothetical protein